MLIVDNVSKDPKGHTLIINLEKEITISGNILDENNKPVLAEINFTDKNGKIIKSFNSDKNGDYSITSNVFISDDYYLNIYNDSSFVKSEVIKPAQAKTYSKKKTLLSFLKIGKTYRFENLVFKGGTAELIPQSEPIMENLYKLMSKNPKLKISIEGHINNPVDMYNRTSNKEALELSEQRAKRVFDYLVEKGIDSNRMVTIGHGDKKMLFPKAKNEEEMEQNRRVELKVLNK
jgi:outer membrane protein OmpA-like peptidoglycan-associated protein